MRKTTAEPSSSAPDFIGIGAFPSRLHHKRLRSAHSSPRCCSRRPLWAEESGSFTHRIEVRVLEIEAVVQDRDGVRIPGLTAGDFRLLVDDQEVPIEYFTAVSDSVVQTAEPAPAGVRAGAQAATSFLIFIDEFFPIQRDKTQVLNALAERLPNMRPSDQIAIVGWNGESLDVLSGWTSSMEQASKAMATAIERPAGGLHRQSERRSFGVTLDPAAQAHSARQQRHNPLRLGTQERMFGGLLIDQLEGTVIAVTSAMLGLDSPPGRRVLILLSGGWPMDVTNSIGRNTAGTISEPNIPSGAELYGPIAKTANLLGYTIYAIDIPGMQQGRNVDASQRFATPTSVASTSMFLENELHRSLGFLAAETGGMALINAGRISALADAGADVRTFYRIGFSPTWTGDDERHDIRVEVASDELLVRARSSFFDLSPATKVGLVLESALLMGLDDGATGLKVEIGDIEPAGRGIVIADVTIVLPATNLVAVQTADGFVMQASLVMVAIDNRGNRSEVPAMPLAFITASKPPPESLIRYKTRLKLRNRTTKLAVALHDTVGGETFARVVTKE